MKNTIITLLFLFSIAQAENNHIDVSKIRKAFQQLDYKTARADAEKIINNWQEYSITELLEVHKILGVINFSEGNLIAAQAQFEQALSLDRNTKLDSVLISPKIISFFNKIKENFKLSSQTNTTQFRYIVLPDPRLKAMLRSVILPGWGQIYSGYSRKGKILISATGVSLLGWGAFYYLQQKARDDYMAARGASIEDKYIIYNRYYKTQRVFSYITGFTWLYALIDILVTPPNLPESRLQITPRASKNHSLSITMQYKFSL